MMKDEIEEKYKEARAMQELNFKAGTVVNLIITLKYRILM